MKKILLVIGLLLCLPPLAQAQDAPKTEVFAGYSYVRFRPGRSFDDINGHGFNGSLAGNVTRNIGLVGDFSIHHATILDEGVNLFSFLFGPRFTSRPGRVEGFVHALLGGARASGGGDSDTSFTYALGGGLDIKASDRVAIRIVQLDYLRTHFSDNWQNNFRYSTGLVFRLGKK